MAHKIIFFGNERLATGIKTEAPLLKSLIEAGYEIVALVVAQKPQGKSRKERPLEVVELAEAHSIEVLAPSNLKLPETAQKLASYGAVAGVLAAYGKMVPKDIIELFPKGIINVHPSLLPMHRGSAPIESVIKNGETETGVSLMSLVVAMDAGPVYAQEKISLSGDEEKQELTNRLSKLGAEMMIKHLPAILDGSLEAKEQDHLQATEDSRISKDDGLLDTTSTAEELERQIRAYATWPKSRTLIGTQEVVVTKAHVKDVNGMPGTLLLDGKELGIHCKEGTLIIDSLIPSGKKEMPASAFLAGYSVNF